jgi:hypothetical protein
MIPYSIYVVDDESVAREGIALAQLIEARHGGRTISPDHLTAQRYFSEDKW